MAPKQTRRRIRIKKSMLRKPKTAKKRVSKRAKKGGMPPQYYGGKVPSNLIEDGSKTTACKVPNTVGNCFSVKAKVLPN
tara:strand:- start:533 stop:769 length:237 start_codon:yes stop_codon:yes gene_type:complete